MNQNNSNSISSSSSNSGSSSSRNSRSTRRGSIRREEGDNDDNDDDDDDDDFGVDVYNDLAPVACPEQMVAYCKTFNLIDKGNANGGSKTHGWTPKLSFRLFNMTLNNAYRMYIITQSIHMKTTMMNDLAAVAVVVEVTIDCP